MAAFRAQSHEQQQATKRSRRSVARTTASRRAASGTGFIGGFRLMRLAGVEIFVDWSLLIIFWLVAASLGAGALPQWHPRWSPLLTWSIAVLAALLLFVSVLLHELAHALAARAKGLEVPRITLFVFGGMAHMAEEPRAPGAELGIALAGPAASILIGVLAMAAGTALAQPTMDQATGSPQSALREVGAGATLLLWLGPINLLLGLFNLVPGFPLDGGRVLRSIIWKVTGDLRKATRWASYSGRFVAWVLMGTGVLMAIGIEVPFFGAGLTGGLWLVLIGWFLSNAAQAAYAQLMVREALRDIPISAMMRASIVTVRPETTIETLVHEEMMRSDQSAFPVVDREDRLIGLVGLEQVRRTPRGRWGQQQVDQIMTPATDLTMFAPAQEAIDALAELSRREVEQLPVVERGKILGLVRRQDIIRWMSLHDRELQAAT